MSFYNVPSDASASIDDAYMESIEPFDYNKIEPFKAVYLSGYLADRYDQTADQCAGKIDERVKGTITKQLKKSVTDLGYENVNVKSHGENITNRTFSYALFPLWLLRTKYKDQFYYFAMNGQTGKVAGKLPVDKAKINLTALALSLLGILIGLGFYLFDDHNLIGGIIAFIISALVIFFASRGSMIRKASNVSQKYDADYYQDAPAKISVNTDTYLSSKTTSVRIRDD